MEGFKKFLFKGNIVDLAVAVVIGGAFSALISSFTKGFIDPLLALLGGQPNLDSLTFTINTTVFPYGLFLTQLVSFVITTAIIYFLVVRPMMSAMRRMNLSTDEKSCPDCLSDIPLAASRCKFCGTVQQDPNVQLPTPSTG
ncbi:large conductance mechanosensitive channel protein MscL [Actinocorallia longicatena]|uniref:Large conductance mechanosensitive channel protein MscL n=1 Tax=Actinocorallia longicatena TaxID=111803 RepID=A0ABP6Q539_9ACTN